MLYPPKNLREKKKSCLLGPLRVSWMVLGIQKLMLWLPSDSMGNWNGEPLLCYEGLKFAFLAHCRCYWSMNPLWVGRACCFCCCLVAELTNNNHFATPWTVAHQASLSVGFPRQEYWNRLPFPSPWDLPYPGIKPTFPALNLPRRIPYHWATREYQQRPTNPISFSSYFRWISIT